MEKIPVIAVLGATASGKTALSVELAKRYKTEIISCDSMQIYRGMDIGTAKPSMAEREGIVHHMIDIIDPDETFSVAQYCQAAHNVASDIHNANKIPILVGGTGLYADSFLGDVDFLENDSNPQIRQELEETAKTKGVDFLCEMLKTIDPKAYEKIHKNNIRRIIRAIEFYKMTGVPISVHQEQTKQKISRYASCIIAISYEMPVLYERIEKRVDLMMEQGLPDEVKGLLSKGYNTSMTSMQAIGYKEMAEYFEGKCSLDEAVDKIKLATRHYAKRQMTWFRPKPDIHWIDSSCDILSETEKITDSFLNM